MLVWRPAALVVGVLILSAFSERPGIPPSFGEHDYLYGKSHGFNIGRLFRPTPVGESPFKVDPDPYGVAVAERTSRIDWSTARTIELTIEERWISPILVNLTKGNPYILRYVNRDSKTRALRGLDFFSSPVSRLASWAIRLPVSRPSTPVRSKSSKCASSLNSKAITNCLTT